MLVGKFFLYLGFGLLTGLVVNYLADVLPRSRKFTLPVCPRCGMHQGWLDYLLHRRCQTCHTYKPARHWLTLGFYLISVTCFFLYPPTRLGFWLGLLLLGYFGVVAIIDIEHRVVLDQISIAGACLALGIGLWLHGIITTVLGGLAGFGMMLILYYTGIWYSRWMARRRGQTGEDEVALGFGDVNLGGIVGLVLGWPGIIAGLLLAIILGGVVSLVYLIILLFNRKWQSSLAVPYAPFLVIGAGLLLYLR